LLLYRPIGTADLTVPVRGSPIVLSCGAKVRAAARKGEKMLETIAIVLLVLWLLGVVSGYTLGNFIYVLLVIAIVLFLVRLVSGRRVV
jgi:uncharacterized membrane protein YjdF